MKYVLSQNCDCCDEEQIKKNLTSRRGARTYVPKDVHMALIQGSEGIIIFDSKKEADDFVKYLGIDSEEILVIPAIESIQASL